MSILNIVILLTLSSLELSFSCSSSLEDENGNKTTKMLKAFTIGKYKLYKNDAFWTPSPSAVAKWGSWYQNWLKNKKNKEKSDKKSGVDGTLTNTGFDSSVPESWKGLGPGIGFQEPPPWAVFKESSGKPHTCFLPPVRGPCRQVHYRWGFNPLKGECVKFVYSGCGSNGNNFLNIRRCQQVCASIPSSSCQSFSRRIGTILIGIPGC